MVLVLFDLNAAARLIFSADDRQRLIEKRRRKNNFTLSTKNFWICHCTPVPCRVFQNLSLVVGAECRGQPCEMRLSVADLTTVAV